METTEAVLYTPEQIFCGLAQVMEEMGVSVPSSMDRRIDEHIKEDKSWDDLDFVDIFFRIEKFFGFHCTKEEWNKLFVFKGLDFKTWEEQVGPRLTFRAWVEFIRERVHGISFGPQTVFGMTSQKAGAFLGIENTVKEMGLTVLKFGPSTDILDRFRSPKLYQFYQRLRWISCNQLPPLRTTFLTIIRRFILVFGTLLSLFLCFIGWIEGQWPSMLRAIFLIPASFAFVRLINLQDNRLPAGIQTFNDLATLLAHKKAN